ncbi:UNVERIFIED_ORG: hypothetical protein J2W74_003406 [Methylorubrum zatmanii]
MSGRTDRPTGGKKRRKSPSTPNGGYIVHRRAANGRIVTPKRRLMFEHASHEEACDEADRLAEIRGGTFTVFEARYSARALERPAPVVDKPAATLPTEPSIKVKVAPAAPPKTNRTPVVEVRRRRTELVGAN